MDNDWLSKMIDGLRMLQQKTDGLSPFIKRIEFAPSTLHRLHWSAPADAANGKPDTIFGIAVSGNPQLPETRGIIHLGNGKMGVWELSTGQVYVWEAE